MGEICVLFACGSVMVPRRIARYTRHAIALASAKYVDPSMGFIVPGMLGETIRAVEAIATPIVMLVYALDGYLTEMQ
jgi:hypothetical protein